MFYVYNGARLHELCLVKSKFRSLLWMFYGSVTILVNVMYYKTQNI